MIPRARLAPSSAQRPDPQRTEPPISALCHQAAACEQVAIGGHRHVPNRAGVPSAWSLLATASGLPTPVPAHPCTAARHELAIAGQGYAVVHAVVRRQSRQHASAVGIPQPNRPVPTAARQHLTVRGQSTPQTPPAWPCAAHTSVRSPTFHTSTCPVDVPAATTVKS